MKAPRAIRQCVQCDAEFGVYHTAQVRCRPCQAKHKNTKPKLYTKPCNRCGEPYHPRDTRSKTCPNCRVEFPCNICGTLCKRKSTGSLYCSTRCAYLGRLIAKHGDRNHLEALKRDGFACRKCGDTYRPHVHHIDGAGLGHERDSRNNALDNLVTLCNSCHGGIHSLTARLLYERYPEDVREILNEYLHSS